MAPIYPVAKLWGVLQMRRCLEQHAVYVYDPANEEAERAQRQRAQDLQCQLVEFVEEDGLLDAREEDSAAEAWKGGGSGCAGATQA